MVAPLSDGISVEHRALLIAERFLRENNLGSIALQPPYGPVAECDLWDHYPTREELELFIRDEEAFWLKVYGVDASKLAIWRKFRAGCTHSCSKILKNGKQCGNLATRPPGHLCPAKFVPLQDDRCHLHKEIPEPLHV